MDFVYAVLEENIVIRIFNTPKSIIFELWRNPKHLANWYGPKGFTTEFQMYFRVGGEWKYTMTSEDGTSFTSKVIYQEIVGNEKMFEGAARGYNSAFDKLEEYLKTLK